MTASPIIENTMNYDYNYIVSSSLYRTDQDDFSFCFFFFLIGSWHFILQEKTSSPSSGPVLWSLPHSLNKLMVHVPWLGSLFPVNTGLSMCINLNFFETKGLTSKDEQPRKRRELSHMRNWIAQLDLTMGNKHRSACCANRCFYIQEKRHRFRPSFLLYFVLMLLSIVFIEFNKFRFWHLITWW